MKRIIISENQYKQLSEEILFHGSDKNPQTYDRPYIWLTYYEDYATEYGTVYKYEIDDDCNFASVEDCEEYYDCYDAIDAMYNSDMDLINALKKDGYDGYIIPSLDNDEYICLINLDKARYIGKLSDDEINENYLYHVGSVDNPENPTPYYSENRWNKWEGAGHETGSFGSGMYFTDAYPTDNRFNDERKTAIRNAEFNPYYDGQRFIEIGKNFFRVDTDFYKNLYVLKSEKEGDVLKELMSAVDSFVRHCRNYEPNDYTNMRYRQLRYLNIQRLCEMLGLNLPWNYKQMIEFGKKYCKDKSITQTPATIFMEKNGYNGVDASRAGKYNSYWEGSVIYNINKLENDIEPVKNPRDEFKLHYSQFSNNMYSDILQGKTDPSYFKTGDYIDNPDSSQKVLMALKRYPMVLSSHKFWSMPEEIKPQYLKILYDNIKKGFINLNDSYYGYSYYQTNPIKELCSDNYIDNIIKYKIFPYINLNDKLTYNIFWELSMGTWKYDKDTALGFLNTFNGDKDKYIDEINEIKEEYGI